MLLSEYVDCSYSAIVRVLEARVAWSRCYCQSTLTVDTVQL